MCGCCTSKQHFIVMACDSKSLTKILWYVIIIKINTGKKIHVSELMTLNHEKI